MNIDGLLVYRMNKSGDLNQLATFLYIKQIYSNSCIFNYTHKSMAKKTGLSESSVRRCMKFFKKNNMVRYHKKNVIFKRLNEIKESPVRVKSKIKSKQLKEIKSELYAIILRLKANQAEWCSKLRHDLTKCNKRVTVKLYKKIMKLDGFHKQEYRKDESDAVGRFKVSFRKMAKWLGKSIGSTHKIIKELSESGKIILFQGGYSSIKKIPGIAKAFIETSRKAFISGKGNVCVVKCNSYKF